MINNFNKTKMKNTFFGLIFLSIIWLSSCGGSMKSDPKTDSASTNASLTEQTVNLEGDKTENNALTVPAGAEGQVVQLTKAIFLEKVYDYEKNPKQWTYKGDKPCIIDFYADWCKPCKMIAPIMAELSEKYKGDIVIYKVNTDQERELAQFFGIRSIPTVFFCPANGDPQMAQGAMAKEAYEKAITEVLLKK
jgi:thioredoxin